MARILCASIRSMGGGLHLVALVTTARPPLRRTPHGQVAPGEASGGQASGDRREPTWTGATSALARPSPCIPRSSASPMTPSTADSARGPPWPWRVRLIRKEEVLARGTAGVAMGLPIAPRLWSVGTAAGSAYCGSLWLPGPPQFAAPTNGGTTLSALPRNGWAAAPGGFWLAEPVTESGSRTGPAPPRGSSALPHRLRRRIAATFDDRACQMAQDPVRGDYYIAMI